MMRISLTVNCPDCPGARGVALCARLAGRAMMAAQGRVAEMVKNKREVPLPCSFVCLSVTLLDDTEKKILNEL